MCGIVAVLDPARNAVRYEARLRRAMDSIAHRGPDGEGFFVDGELAFGFRRLSILDPSELGTQPMTSHDGRFVTLYNGEVYNFLELRRELRAAGAVFRGDSDTEVVVESLARLGPEQALARWNGMWALLAFDREARALYACRDPFAIKPLYRARLGDALAFASEIKALAALGCELGELDALRATRFVEAGELDADHRTLFTRVERLEPGVLYRFDAHGKQSTARPHEGDSIEVPPCPSDGSGDRAFVEAFGETFVDAVRIRLRSDVPLGTSLSGGLDSTAVAGATARIVSGERISPARHAFTALFEQYDERRYIEPLVREQGIAWHVTGAAEPGFPELASRFFAVHDEPVHSLGPLAGFLVMRLAHQHGVRVLLNGQGSDELLAGYPSSAGPFLRSIRRQEGWLFALREAAAERAALGEVVRRRSRLALGSLRSRGQPAGLLSPDFAVRRPWRTPAPDLASYLRLNQQQSPLPLYLRIEDANSSAFSLEARLPFLDPRVVALARAAPARLLRRRGRNKFLLRSILPGLVPRVVYERRDKLGFPVPHGPWLRGPLRSLLLDTLAAERVRERGWYDAPAIAARLEAFLRSDGLDVPPALLRVFLLERFARDRFDALRAEAAATRA